MIAPLSLTERTPVHARLGSVDLLRGVVMVLMALDHVRDCFTVPSYPIDLSTTTPGWFFTRWVAEFCAPVFVFLAGSAAFLSGVRGKPRPQLASFLFTRGLWLVILELTLVRFGWFLNLNYQWTMLQVIWVIGVSMIVLAPMVFLPTWAVGICGIMLISLHNLSDGVDPDGFGAAGWVWTLLHGSPTVLEPFQNVRVLAIYPLVPWLGILAAGYGFGPLLLLERPRRCRIFLGLGAALTVAFGILRATNRYGDPVPWSAGHGAVYTLMSFLNCEKYPPSLLYVLMTLGPAIIALALFDGSVGPVAQRFVALGRVPLFYYVLHLVLIHLAAVGFALLRYGRAGFLLEMFSFENKDVPHDYAYGLFGVYVITACIVIALYPACIWFGTVKQRSKSGWLAYL
jgi:uncharacterized membrane protein